LHYCVVRMALPIHFFSHVCSRMYLFATFLYDVLFSRNTQQKPNCRNFRICQNSHVKCGPMTWLFQTRHFWQFSFAAIPYVVHSMISQISLLSDSDMSRHFSLQCLIRLLDPFIFYAVPFSFFIPLFFNFLFGSL